MASRGAGAAVGAVTFAAYMVGSGRAYGYDAAVTVDQFVTRGWSTPFTEQTVYNNHPLFSLVEHAVYVVAGSSEPVLRAAPCLFAAMAVGLLVWYLGERWGLAAGVAAGVVLTANPMLVPLARDVRGYSLAVLALVVAGIALAEDRPNMFAVAAFVAVGTHLHAVVPVGLAVLWLIGSGRFSPRWRVPLYAAGLASVLVYVGMVDELGGGQGFVWQTRFLFWAVPAVAVGVGWLVGRDGRWLVPVAVMAVALLVPILPDWTADEIPNREVAAHVGDDVCGATGYAESVAFYVDLTFDYSCAQAVLIHPEATDAPTLKAQETWPVVCWRTDLGELRAVSEAAC